MRVPCRMFGAWFGPAVGPNPVRNRRFPAGFLQVFEAGLAQPSLVPLSRSPEIICVHSCSVFQAGAVGNGPGPNFGRKPTQHRSKTYPKPIKNRSKTYPKPILQVCGALLAQPSLPTRLPPGVGGQDPCGSGLGPVFAVPTGPYPSGPSRSS